jgi:hypothetical protein
VLILVVGALIVYSGYTPTVRVPILAGAATEKLAIGVLIFRWPDKRTTAMTAIAAGDTVFAILYLAYLAGI